MRILFYCDEYPPAHHGGIGSVVKLVSEALAQKGHDIYVVGTYMYGHSLPYYSVINNVKVYRLTYFNYLRFVPGVFKRMANKLFKKLHILNFIAKSAIAQTECFIEEIIQNNEIECIELVDYMELFQYLEEEIVFKKFKIPTVMRVHGSQSFIGSYTNYINSIWLKNDINNFDRCDMVIAVSRYSANFTIDHLGVDSTKLHIIYNPIEDKFFSNKPTKHHNNKILFIGKITETKGVFSLIKAFNEIAKEYSSYNLSLVGSGDIKKAKSHIDPKLLGRVNFTGFVHRNEISNLIDESVFCVVPTYFENFSMVALEIMGRGKALIYGKRTSGPEIIDHLVNGILIDPENIEDLTNQMRLLLNNENLRYEMGLAAQKKVKNSFRVDKAIIALEERYLESILRNNTIN